ncbi:SAF domain-containing protein [Aeromicrobium sp. Leaf272]|uniref:SAF domain-containing protein n=1 Tax=Aeromicrobium sp. Leaf272 TaxID=1736317 RepID=UPI000701197B|nr:SAF domain-containing protein [Aeromicrobium sp. Leaf272]KQP27287.1 hypothetical protein ASF38_05920 [Aeromicrobium sp. Leaf272]
MDRLRSAVLDHRRLLAAVCTGLAVLLTVVAVRQPGDTVTVAVAAADLPSGHALTDADVTVARLPRTAAPTRVLTDVETLLGRRVGGPMRAGEVFTDARVLSAGTTDQLPEGHVVTTLRLADAAATQGLRVGDRVDVVAVAARDDGPRATVVATSAQVAAVPAPDGAEEATLAVQTPRETALTLARAGLEAQLSVVAVSPGTA